MKRGLTFTVVFALALTLLSGCGGQKAEPFTVLSGPNGRAAAAMVADMAEGGVLAEALSDRAALEQLADGNCEFVVVSEKQLRDAITGEGDYNGMGLGGLQRVDNLLLGIYCVFSASGEISSFPYGADLAVLGGEESPAYALTLQIAQAGGFTVFPADELSVALERLKSGQSVAVAGMFLPGDESVQRLRGLGAVAVPTLDFTQISPPDPSMVVQLALPLYEGMTQVQAYHFFGVLAKNKDIDEQLERRVLSKVMETDIHVESPPVFPFDKE